MKRAREKSSSVDLNDLLKKFEALSIVIEEEIPAVLQAGVRVPPSFAPSTKARKVTFGCP